MEAGDQPPELLSVAAPAPVTGINHTIAICLENVTLQLVATNRNTGKRPALLKLIE